MQVDAELTEIGAEPLTADDPRQIGPFRIRAVLGSGGMGKVYLGFAADGRPVSVKRIRPDLAHNQPFLTRFGKELDNQERLPAGVGPRLLASDRTAKPPWFATEYLPGITLDQAVDLAGGALPVSQCRVLLAAIAEKLRLLADVGMVHRDLKPSNLMLTADGVRLIDFGLSLLGLQTRQTSAGAIGTLPYMAPEQLLEDEDAGEGEARVSLTPAVDVFALGGVINYAATGKAPFGSGPAVGYRIMHAEPDLDLLRSLDPKLGSYAARCLAKSPENRPAADRLAPARGTVPLPSWPSPVTERITQLQSLVVAQWDSTGPTAGPAGATAGGSAGTSPTDPYPGAPAAGGPLTAPTAGTGLTAETGPAGGAAPASGNPPTAATSALAGGGFGDRAGDHAADRTNETAAAALPPAPAEARKTGSHRRPRGAGGNHRTTGLPKAPAPASAAQTTKIATAPPGTPPGTPPGPAAGRRGNRRRWLVPGLIAALVLLAGGITAFSLSTGSPKPSPAPVTSPVDTTSSASPSPSPSPTRTKRSTPTASPSTPLPAPPVTAAPTPTPVPQHSSVISAAPTVLENTGAHQCLAGTSDYDAQLVSCAAGSAAQAWKGENYTGSAWALVNQSSGNCLNDHFGVISADPCDPSGNGTTHWQPSAPTSSGAVTLEDPVLGECLTTAGGLGMDTCNRRDPSQLWSSAGS